jgi:hypothetical protein
MSDDLKEQVSDTEQTESGTTQKRDGVDEILKFYCFIANNSHIEFPVTINVSGQLISGTIVSKLTYLARVRALFEEATEFLDPDVKQFFDKTASPLFEIVDEAEAKDQAEFVDWDNLY